MRPRTLPAALLPLWILGSTPAAGYVRTRTDDGVPVRWTGSCVLESADTAGAGGLTGADLDEVLQQAMDNWGQATRACSALSLLPRAPGPHRAQADGLNTVLFVTGTWGRGAARYDPSAAAVTTVTYVRHPGQPDHGTILDADIELNAVHYHFQRAATGAPPADADPTQQDLENTLTHELGHVLGLSHNCQEAADPRRAIDGTGQPAPPCDDEGAAAEVLRAGTMFPFAAPLETGKRHVSADDAAGVCEPYPRGAPLPPCEGTVYGGCGVAATDLRGDTDDGDRRSGPGARRGPLSEAAGMTGMILLALRWRRLRKGRARGAGAGAQRAVRGGASA